MQKDFTNSKLLWIVVALSFFIDRPLPANTYINSLQQVNQFSPLEGAGSHGSWGIKLGLGLQVNEHLDPIQTPPSTDKSVVDQALNEGLTVAPRFFMTKGLSFPIDFGLTYAMVSQSEVQQWAGYVQWTTIQSLGWPALAVRYSLAKLTGATNAELTTHTAEVVGSYGFLRYFNLILSFRNHNHIGTLHEESEDRHFHHTRSTQGAGLEITILPPFTTMGLEMAKNENDSKQYQGKIGYLF